jgi:hypothetical protein
MAQAMTSQDVQDAWSTLVADVRTAVLLTLKKGRPFGSHMPYVFGLDTSLSPPQPPGAPYTPSVNGSPCLAVHR